MAGNPGQFFGNVFGLENKIDASGGDGAAGHGIVFRRIILGEGNSALSFDRFQAERAVGGSAGKDDSDGVFSLALSQ
jgi:hypothetical protein